jgi:glycosyltransferase involved in cell wall biosynthesis
VPGRLHDLGAPPLSRRASLRRAQTSGAARAAWSLARAPFALLERRTGRSLHDEWIARQVEARLPRILAEGSHDLVAAKAPPLNVAEAARRVAEQGGAPFAYVMGDPVDHRGDDEELQPRGRDRQQALIESSAAFLTRQAPYERHYARLFRHEPSRVVFFEDSFIPLDVFPEEEPRLRLEGRALFHWGQVDPWRPLDTLVEALARQGRFGLTVMGTIVDASMERLARRRLGDAFLRIPARPLPQARAVARTAWAFVVLVSHRHRDNIPSKLLDALAFGRPVLLLAHPDSASAALVRGLGIGAVADIREVDSVLGGLRELDERREELERAYRGPGLTSWRYDEVGRRFREGLFRAMRW